MTQEAEGSERKHYVHIALRSTRKNANTSKSTAHPHKPEEGRVRQRVTEFYDATISPSAESLMSPVPAVPFLWTAHSAWPVQPWEGTGKLCAKGRQTAGGKGCEGLRHGPEYLAARLAICDPQAGNLCLGSTSHSWAMSMSPKCCQD